MPGPIGRKDCERFWEMRLVRDYSNPDELEIDRIIRALSDTGMDAETNQQSGSNA